MGRAYSKAAKRRAKKDREAAGAGLPALEASEPRQPNGQRRNRADRPRDPQKTALQARVRQSGGEDTPEGRRAVSAPHMGCQIGMVMDHQITGKGRRDEIAALWRTFSDWRMAEESYRRRYLGQSEHAKGATIQMMPDRFETDQRASVDLRSEEERDRAAINNWMRWQGYLGMIDRAQMAALHDARLDRVTLWGGRGPTGRGLYALASLKALHIVVTGRP